MKRKKLNIKGAALVWVALASTVVAILAAGLIAVAAYYYNTARSDALDMTQSFLNCKSGIKTVYSYISEVPTDSDSAAKAVYDKAQALSVGDSVTVGISNENDGEIVSVKLTKQTPLVLELVAESEASSDKCVLKARVTQDVFDSQPVWKDLTFTE